MGAGKSPVAKQPTRSTDLQSSLKDRREEEPKMKAINQIKEHTGRKAAGGPQEREGSPGKYTKNMKCAATYLHVGLAFLE